VSSTFQYFDPEASPESQFLEVPPLLSPLPGELELAEPAFIPGSPPSPSYILVAETIDSEVFQLPRSPTLTPVPVLLSLAPPGSPATAATAGSTPEQEVSSLSPDLGPLVLPPRAAAFGGALVLADTFGVPTHSLPAASHSLPASPRPRTPLADLPVPENDENNPPSPIPSPPITFPDVYEQPWENRCPFDEYNPHQCLAIQTERGEELSRHPGDIFVIPSARSLFHSPPTFPSVFPFYSLHLHKQRLTPSPTIATALPGALPTLHACSQVIRVGSSDDIPLGYIQFSFRKGLADIFSRLPSYCLEAYRDIFVLLEAFDFLDGRLIYTYGYLHFANNRVFVRRQSYFFSDALQTWPSLLQFTLTPRCPLDPFLVIPVHLDSTPL
jgi:hypothetical protein